MVGKVNFIEDLQCFQCVVTSLYLLSRRLSSNPDKQLPQYVISVIVSKVSRWQGREGTKNKFN